jgi:hypothetical protein
MEKDGNFAKINEYARCKVIQEAANGDISNRNVHMPAQQLSKEKQVALL